MGNLIPTLADAAALPVQIGAIFYFIVLPMLLLIGVGYAVQRFVGLHMPTLVRLNFYFIVPSMIYVSVVESPLGAGMVWQVILFHLAVQAGLCVLAVVLAKLRGIPSDERATMLMGTVFYNSGNYGLPLQELAFRNVGRGDQAFALQVFVMIVQNLTSFTLGILLVSGGGRAAWRRNLMHIIRFPPIYALSAGILTVILRGRLGDNAPALAEAFTPFWDALVNIKAAFIAVALATLGAQLANMRQGEGRRYPVKMTVFLRLLAGPAVGLGLIYAFGINGFLAQVLLISCATPTAVNAMLLCMEFENHPDYAARAVLYSTLLSPITVTLVIFLAQGRILPGFAMP